jgi:DNA-binding transcriptional LysR family regulator
MTRALESAGRKWRVVLDSASSQVVKACVESGLAATLLDRARISPEMRVLDGLPRIADHEVVIMRGDRSRTTDATERLAATLRQQFRLS